MQQLYFLFPLREVFFFCHRCELLSNRLRIAGRLAPLRLLNRCGKPCSFFFVFAVPSAVPPLGCLFFLPGCIASRLEFSLLPNLFGRVAVGSPFSFRPHWLRPAGYTVPFFSLLIGVSVAGDFIPFVATSPPVVCSRPRSPLAYPHYFLSDLPLPTPF